MLCTKASIPHLQQRLTSWLFASISQHQLFLEGIPRDHDPHICISAQHVNNPDACSRWCAFSDVPYTHAHILDAQIPTSKIRICKTLQLRPDISKGLTWETVATSSRSSLKSNLEMPASCAWNGGIKKNDSAGRLQNPTFGYCGLSDDTPQISRVIIIHFPHQVWPYSIFIGCIFQTNPVGYGWDLCDFQCLCWHLEALDFGSGICSPENQFTWHQLAPDGFFQWLVPYQE